MEFVGKSLPQGRDIGLLDLQFLTLSHVMPYGAFLSHRGTPKS